MCSQSRLSGHSRCTAYTKSVLPSFGELVAHSKQNCHIAKHRYRIIDKSRNITARELRNTVSDQSDSTRTPGYLRPDRISVYKSYKSQAGNCKFRSSPAIRFTGSDGFIQFR